MAVSDVLGLLVDEVFPNYSSYGGPMLVLAAVFYTFQLYFNFSGYSEVARAVGLLLGLTLPENFKTPFFATNFFRLLEPLAHQLFRPGCRIICSCRWRGPMFRAQRTAD